VTMPDDPAERRRKMTVNFKTWELSTEHAACSYGQPVLVNRATGDAYGAADVLKPYPHGNSCQRRPPSHAWPPPRR
jgi:hypothetical protein